MAFNSESRTVNASKNAMYSLINKVLSLLLVFISRKVFITHIGIEYLGINSLFANILTLLSMADLGLGTAMNVSLYKPIAEKNIRKLSALLNYYEKLYRIIALAVAIIGCAIIPFLKYIVNLPNSIPNISLYYIVFLVNTVVSYLFVYKASIINADQKGYVVNKIGIVINCAKVLLQIVTIIIFKNYLLYIILDVFGTLANNLVISRTVDKQYSFIKERHLLTEEEKKGIFSNVSSVFLYKISWSLINGTDNILMSVIVGTVSVGLYANYYTITSNIEAIIALVFMSLTAGIGNLIATSKEEKRYEIFSIMQMVSYWLCGVSVVCTFILADGFITLWIGKDYVLDKIVLIAIVFNLFFSLCMRPVWTFREGTGMYKEIRYIMLVTALLNIGLSIFLGRMLGLAGIIFATSISKLFTYFWYEPNILFRRFFKTSVSKYYISQLMNLLLMLVCGGICYFTTGFISLPGIFGWSVKAVICFGVTNIIYYIRYRNSHEFRQIIDRVKIITSR